MVNLNRRCGKPGCGAAHQARNLCNNHYQAWRAAGMPDVPYVTRSRNPVTREAFWVQVDKTAANGCWEWRGRLDRGYGATSSPITGASTGAHRVAWLYERGAFPAAGLELDHLCRNRKCVNPAHLEPVERKVNSLRSESPPAKLARRTECGNGHAYEGSNLGHRKDGSRICRQCGRDRYHRRAAHRRAAA